MASPSERKLHLPNFLLSPERRRNVKTLRWTVDDPPREVRLPQFSAPLPWLAYEANVAFPCGCHTHPQRWGCAELVLVAAPAARDEDPSSRMWLLGCVRVAAMDHCPSH
jgi:hypothetical protein